MIHYGEYRRLLVGGYTSSRKDECYIAAFYEFCQVNVRNLRTFIYTSEHFKICVW